MKQLIKLVSYRLNGSPGWSRVAISNIDITKITNISYRKRLFRIFDRDKLYSLEIEYQDFPYNFPIFDKYRYTSLSEYMTDRHMITKRYAFEHNVKHDFHEIKLRIKALKLRKL